MKLLHVDASILGEGSVSRQLSAAIVARLREAHPDIEVTYYDLGAQPIGHLTGAHLAARQGAVADTASLQHDVARGQQALEDFLAADIVVAGAPMYNFSVSSQLKAWRAARKSSWLHRAAASTARTRPRLLWTTRKATFAASSASSASRT